MPLSDDELHAYADNQLSRERASEVAQTLAHESALATRVDEIRRHNALLREALDPWLGEPLPRELLAAAAGWEIAVRATQSDRVELSEVLAQIGRLPPEQREVLILAAVEELRYEEISAVLGVPIGTVMSRLSRAREKLRRMTTEAPTLKVVR